MSVGPGSLATPQTSDPELSFVCPAYDEERNLPSLVAEIESVAASLDRPYEVIIVDDGSTDGTRALLEEFRETNPRLVPVYLARNYGQSTAMQAGFDAARGRYVITLDSDLQSDPADIPKLLQVLEEQDVDVVSGWRADRQDKWLRSLLSRAANLLISKLTRLKLHDYGCTLKIYRREVLDRIRVYGELHRFLPALMSDVGAAVTEIPVNHRPRTAGQSKYGFDRTFRVVLDLLLIVFLRNFIQRPIHFFGSIGFAFGAVGVVLCSYLVYVKLALGHDIGDRPLLLLGVALVLGGLFLVSQGILGELIIRTLHETGGRQQYQLRITTQDDHRD